MTKQSQKKYDRLLDKAQELFLKYGYKNVSVDQIASEAGISKMTVYKHFPSKEDLFIAAIIKYSDYHMDIVRKKLDEQYHTIDKLKCLNVYAIEANKGIQADFYKEVFDRPYVLEKLVEYKRNASYSLWKEILEDGVKKGDIRNVDTEFVAQLMMNMPGVLLNLVDLYADIYSENGLNSFLEKLFDFMQYGLLGGLDNTPKE